jgi:hypothetical protein
MATPRIIKGRKIETIPMRAKGSFHGLTPLRSASLVQYLVEQEKKRGEEVLVTAVKAAEFYFVFFNLID